LDAEVETFEMKGVRVAVTQHGEPPNVIACELGGNTVDTETQVLGRGMPDRIGISANA
jgi:hypothetical protein